MIQRFTYGIVAVCVASSSIYGQGNRQPSSAPSSVYLVAATPIQWDEDAGPYPTALFRVASGRNLQVVRRLFTLQQGFKDIADDLNGTLYLAGDAGISLIHENDPAREDFLPVKGPFAYDDIICWGAIAESPTNSYAQYCPTTESGGVVRISKSANSSRLTRGEFRNFRNLRFGGENACFQVTPPFAEVMGNELVMLGPAQEKVTLTTLPPGIASEIDKIGKRAWIVTSTERYLTFAVVPESWRTNISATSPSHSAPLKVYLLDRYSQSWRILELPTSITSSIEPPVRIFGDWLVTTVMNWSGGEPDAFAVGPGIENERVTELNNVPPIRAEYANSYRGLSIPGKLILQNLADNRRVVLDTGQEDSEILAIRGDGDLIYRVNDSVYETRIEGDHLHDPGLLAKQDEVADVHWAFWGSQQTVKKPRSKTAQRR